MICCLLQVLLSSSGKYPTLGHVSTQVNPRRYYPCSHSMHFPVSEHRRHEQAKQVYSGDGTVATK